MGYSRIMEKSTQRRKEAEGAKDEGVWVKNIALRSLFLRVFASLR